MKIKNNDIYVSIPRGRQIRKSKSKNKTYMSGNITMKTFFRDNIFSKRRKKESQSKKKILLHECLVIKIHRNLIQVKFEL